MALARIADSPFTPSLLILLAPVLAFLLLRLPAISQNNFTDAMYYLGYSRNFVDLVDRYGFVYYAVRFGPIFSEMTFSHLFGATTGFHLLRYLLSVGVAWQLHAVLAERYGKRAALLGVLAWSFNPVTARVLLSTYVDSTVVPFTLMGLLMLLRDWRRSLQRSFAAGVLLCAGVSGNVYAGVMIAFALPAYVGLNRHRRLQSIASDLLAAFAGAALPLLLFTGLYDHLFGATSLLQPAIDVTLRLAGGDAKQWTRPAQQWLLDSPHIYAPFLILLATLTVWRWRRDQLALAAAGYLSLFLLFYWFSDLVLDGYSLSFYPYFSYWQAPLMLGVGVVCAQVLRGGGGATRSRAIAGWLIGALVGPPLLFAHTEIQPPAFGWLAGAMAAAAGWLLSLRSELWRPYGLIALIAASVLLQTGSPVYRTMLGDPASDDRETVRAALDLIEVLPRVAEDGKELAFWYSSVADRRIRMVQSAYLPFSRLQHADRSPVELGPLRSIDLEPLHNPQLAHLVILDFSHERVELALQALNVAHIPYRLAQRRRLGSKRYALEMAQLILEHRTDPTVAELPATALRPHPDAVMRYDADGAILMTGKVIRNWDATMDLDDVIRPGLPVTVSVTLQVLEGRASLALIRRGAPDRVLQENPAAQTHRPVQVSVTAREADERDVLVLRNQMQDGTRAVVRIRSITILQPDTDYASLPAAPIP